MRVIKCWEIYFEVGENLEREAIANKVGKNVILFVKFEWFRPEEKPYTYKGIIQKMYDSSFDFLDTKKNIIKTLDCKDVVDITGEVSE